MTAQRNFDGRCYDLAIYFLDFNADEETICELAQAIQDTVENWRPAKTEAEHRTMLAGDSAEELP